MVFADTLSSLADKQTFSQEGARDEHFLDVYERRHFLGFLPIRRRVARLYLRIVNDEWRVMLSDPRRPDGPFFGADYSTTEGEDVTSALRGVWIREAEEWRRCASSEAEEIGQRIARAIELAQRQYSGPAI